MVKLFSLNLFWKAVQVSERKNTTLLHETFPQESFPITHIGKVNGNLLISIEKIH